MSDHDYAALSDAALQSDLRKYMDTLTSEELTPARVAALIEDMIAPGKPLDPFGDNLFHEAVANSNLARVRRAMQRGAYLEAALALDDIVTAYAEDCARRRIAG